MFKFHPRTYLLHITECNVVERTVRTLPQKGIKVDRLAA